MTEKSLHMYEHWIVVRSHDINGVGVMAVEAIRS